MNVKKIGKKGVFTGAIALAMLTGVVGGQVLKTTQSNAQTPSTPAANTVITTPAANNGTPSALHDGTFHSNENPAHEAQESPQREAQENAGQFPTVK